MQTRLNVPNRSLTPWRARDINTLVTDTKVEHPDETTNESKQNAWTKPPRITRINTLYTYETVEDNVAAKPKLKNSVTKHKEVKCQETPAPTSSPSLKDISLLNDIKSLKKSS